MPGFCCTACLSSYVRARTFARIRLGRAGISRYDAVRVVNTVYDAEESFMIILGIVLLIVGFIAKVAILWTIGIVLVVVGAVLYLLGSMGRAVGGRRHYF
jgi:hypothetical protein